jgi:hypothetical protein
MSGLNRRKIEASYSASDSWRATHSCNPRNAPLEPLGRKLVCMSNLCPFPAPPFPRRPPIVRPSTFRFLVRMEMFPIWRQRRRSTLERLVCFPRWANFFPLEVSPARSPRRARAWRPCRSAANFRNAWQITPRYRDPCFRFRASVPRGCRAPSARERAREAPQVAG